MMGIPALWLRRRRGIAGAIVKSEEALVGTRVRVSAHLQSEQRGRVGMITGRWGHPSFVALDVLLDDGSSELFWHHELEEIEGVT
jgi:hypothetical protein